MVGGNRYFHIFDLYSWGCVDCHTIYCFLMANLQTVELQKLILAHNDIELLKEDLKNLTSLVVLNLSHNKLTRLPATIGEYDLFVYLF